MDRNDLFVVAVFATCSSGLAGIVSYNSGYRQGLKDGRASDVELQVMREDCAKARELLKAHGVTP